MAFISDPHDVQWTRGAISQLSDATTRIITPAFIHLGRPVIIRSVPPPVEKYQMPYDERDSIDRRFEYFLEDFEVLMSDLDNFLRRVRDGTSLALEKAQWDLDDLLERLKWIREEEAAIKMERRRESEAYVRRVAVHS